MNSRSGTIDLLGTISGLQTQDHNIGFLAGAVYLANTTPRDSDVTIAHPTNYGQVGAFDGTQVAGYRFRIRDFLETGCCLYQPFLRLLREFFFGPGRETFLANFLFDLALPFPLAFFLGLVPAGLLRLGGENPP